MTKQKASTIVKSTTRVLSKVEANTALAATQEQEARARQTGTAEESVRVNDDSAYVVSQTAADLEDQSSLRPDAATSNTRNRPGRPKNGRVARTSEGGFPSTEDFVTEAKRDLRAGFADLFAKRKKIIRKLGNSFEKVLAKASDVCEAIKDALAQEIRDKVISARDIERHCLAKWKKKTKPRGKNDSLSFSEKELKTRKLVKQDYEEADLKEKTLQEPELVAYILGQRFKITRDKFPEVQEAIRKSTKECHLWFNDKHELESISSDNESQAETAVME